MTNQETGAGSPKKKSWLKDFLLIFLYALVIAIVLKAFIVDSRVVPSSSMYPTIEISDRVVLFRLSYIGERSPQRGDIVVFAPPADSGEKLDLIKRVIGLPGDTLEVKNGSVYIDGVALAEDYLNDTPDYTYGPVTVPEGHYFMMGDNRNNSRDSHAWADPFVSEDQIKGRAVCRYWPPDRIGAI
jgi:signal peptidase I